MSTKKYLVPVLLLVSLTISGCAMETLPRLFWPPPPGEMFLEFKGVYYSENDFEKSKWAGFLESFLGANPGATFQRPTGIASDGLGRVYVADQLLKNVRVFDFNQKTVYMLMKSSVISRPAGLAIDGQKRLYVVDGGEKRVGVFAPDHTFLYSFGGAAFFENPSFIALNERLGRVYVSDGKSHKVVVFDLQGQHLFTFGQLGSDPGKFHSPQGIAISRANEVFVADQFNARVQVFAADGVYLRQFGTRGDGIGQMEMPKDLAFDSDDHLYLVDVRRGSLTVFNTAGEPFFYLGGAKSGDPLTLANPSFISIDATDRIFITDMINQRFVSWQYLSPAYLQAHPITDEDLQILKSHMR